jgi:two-component system chemotaxis sensor kinase CheA
VAIDRDKYRRLFIDESREGLAAIGNELVGLERAARAGSSTPEAAKSGFDVVFRHAHSLKGMGAAMGYARFAHLAHHLEDVADLGRQGRALTSEAWDLLLSGCDALERCVDAVAGGAEDPDPGELVVRVDAFLARERASSAVSPATPSPASPASPAPASPAPALPSPALPSPALPSPALPVRGDGPMLGVRVQIAADATLPQVRAFVVHKALSAHAGYVDTTPSPELLRQKELPEFAAKRQLLFRFRADAARDAIVAAAQAAQGVASVDVVEMAPPAPEPSRERVVDDRARMLDEDRTVRVRTALLDDLIDSVGEVLLTRSRLRALSARLDVPELSELVDEVDRLTRELHGRVVAARMTPLSFMAERLPRAVRDLARQQHKTIDFSMSGMDIELDRAILDELQAPLIHLLRNAVDHAHEGDDARAARGRPSSMKLTLRAMRDRDRVLLELQDDGKGLDADAIRKKAIDRGLIDRGRAETLSTQAVFDLICLPGFSTAEQVTETSGRGVGMDVVKASVEKLGGVLRIHSKKDVGTTMTLQLPLTVAIIQVLVVDAGTGDDGYALPVARVDRAIAVDDSCVTTTGGRAWLAIGERLVPFVDLGALLQAPSAAARRPLPPSGGIAIVVGSGRDELALRVQAIIGQEEVVAKPLGPPLSTLPFIAGGAVLADGRAAYILEPSRLVGADAGAARVE